MPSCDAPIPPGETGAGRNGRSGEALMMKRNGSVALIPALALFLAAGAAAPTFAQSAPAADASMMTKDDVITGTMDINFTTRTNLDSSGDLKEGSAAMDAKDSYKFDLFVADTTEFAGEIQRSPKLLSKILGRTKQEAKLYYNVRAERAQPARPQAEEDGRQVGRHRAGRPVDGRVRPLRRRRHRVEPAPRQRRRRRQGCGVHRPVRRQADGQGREQGQPRHVRSTSA